MKTRLFFLFIIFTLLIIAMSATAMAGVTVTGATGGTAISADKTGGAYTALTGPIMVETGSGSIGTGTIVLNAPTGFVLSTSGVTALVTNSEDFWGVPLEGSITRVTTYEITFTVTRASSVLNCATIQFMGIKVRPSSGTPLASGNITRGGTATINGESSYNYGTLTEVVGAAAALAFTTQPSGTDASEPLNPQPVVQINDQFGNKTASTSNVVLSLTTGTGTLTGTSTKAAIAGVATFTDLSIATTMVGPFGLTATVGSITNASSTWSFNALPVQMTSFTASLQGTSALLKWETATETNNSGFQIERSIEGSNVWVEVAFVNGAGTSNAPKTYSYEDKNLAPGTYVYRMKQIDNDGTCEYYTANMPKVDAGVSNTLQLCGNYPNPFNPTTNMQFSVPQDGYASLKIYNMLGQEVATLFSGIAKAGHYIPVTFNASRLASGIYFARLQYNGKSLVQRMLMTK